MENEKGDYEPSEPKPNLPRVSKVTIESEISESLTEQDSDGTERFAELRDKIKDENPELYEFIFDLADSLEEDYGQEVAMEAVLIGMKTYSLLRRQSIADQFNKEIGEK